MIPFSAGDVRSYLEHLGFMPDLQPGCTTYLFLSGASLGSDASSSGSTIALEVIPAREDHYDDVCLTYLEGGELTANKGTSDPGSYHYHRQGRANLVWCHPHTFVRGKHNGNGQAVLRPEGGSNRFWRDADGDARQDAEEGIQGGNGTMLIHAMGGSRIQRWGAGCLGIWDPKNYRGELWAAWRDQAYRTCEKLGTVQVVIMPGSDFARYLADPKHHQPTLWPGATGPWVVGLQRRLNSWSGDSRQQLGVDGDFGRGTLKRLLEFQAEGALTADGIVGPRTWASLAAWRD